MANLIARYMIDAQRDLDRAIDCGIYKPGIDFLAKDMDYAATDAIWHTIWVGLFKRDDDRVDELMDHIFIDVAEDFNR